MAVIIGKNKVDKRKERERILYHEAIKARDDCVEKLAPVYQEALYKGTLSLVTVKRIANLHQFTRGVILLKGKGGTGKTLTMTQLLYNLRKYFGMPTITDYPLKPAYGEHKYISTGEYIEILKEIDKQVKIRKDRTKELSDAEINERFGNFADEAMRKRGIVFDNAAIGWDEANRKLEASRANSNLVMIHRYFVQTWRHYQCALILCTPELSDITPKALNQLTIELGCSYDHIRQEAVAMGVHRDSLRGITMYTYMPNYGIYYNTHEPISIREAIMGFRGTKL